MKNIVYTLLLLMAVLGVSCGKDDETSAVKTLSITSVWPGSAPAGSIVIINGKNFSGIREENEVKFNGVAAVVIEANPAQLQVVTPEGGSTGAITIAVHQQQATGPVFNYTLPPVEYIVSTLAGDGTAGSVEGSGTAARFRNPEGVAVDAQGNIIVVDRGNNRIRKISGSTVSAIAGVDAGGFKDGAAATALFKLPWRSVADAAGNIYVADRDNHRIRKIAADGTVSTVAGSGVAGFADGPAATAKFNQPLDVVVDPAGNLYVADNLNHRIRKISIDGTVSTIAGDGTAAYADGTGTAAKFKNPSGLELDKEGNLWIADRLNQRIRKITPAGVVTTVAGDGTSGYIDGVNNAARFADPYGITLDKDGNLIIADLSNNKIRMVAGGQVSTIAGTSSGFADGPGSAAQFNQPTDVCMDAAGNIYVADLGNHRIRKIVKK